MTGQWWIGKLYLLEIKYMDVGVYRLNRSGKRVRSHDHHHLMPLLQSMGFSPSKREPS